MCIFFRMLLFMGRHSGSLFSNALDLLSLSMSHPPLVSIHNIHKPSLWSTSLPPARQIHVQHHPPHIPLATPPDMSKPSQPSLPCFVPKPTYVCCSSDLIISDFIHPRHSKSKSQHLQFRYFQLRFLLFRQWYCFHTVQHGGSHFCFINLPLFLRKPFCHMSLLPSSSTHSILIALSSLPPYHGFHYSVPLTPKCLNSSSFVICTPCSLIVSPSLPLRKMYSVLVLLTFIPLLSSAYLHPSNSVSTSSRFSQHLRTSQFVGIPV